MADSWLSDVTIVAEADDPAQLGFVDIFRCRDDMCSYLEHWWVEDKHGFAFTASGDQLVLGVDEGAVIVAEQVALPNGKEIVERALRMTAFVTLELRRERSQKGSFFRPKGNLGEAEKRGELPQSIEGLIAYIGFKE